MRSTREAGRAALAAALAVSFLPAGAAAGDWPNWRGPHRTGVSDETGLVGRWSRAGENLALEGGPHGARHADRVRRPRLHERPRRRRAHAPRAGGLLRRGHRARSCGSAASPSTTPRCRSRAWAGPRWPATPRRAPSSPRTWTASSWPSTATGKTVWEHRLGEEYGRGSGYGGRTLIPLVDEDRVVVGIVGAGWGDIGPPRQRYMAFDKKTGAVRWISTPAQGPFDDANNQASPTVAVIGGRRLVIGGGADGWIYAVEARTGEPVWRYQLSVRGLNSPPAVDGDVVYAAHSEENPDGGPMGAVVAIDGKGSGDVTKTATLWRAEGLTVGFAAPTVAPGTRVRGRQRRQPARPRPEDGPRAVDPQPGDGRPRRAAPRRRQALPDRAERQDPDRGARAIRRRRRCTRSTITMPEGRSAEVWGSVAVAYGRIYFTTEEGLYAVGRKGAPFKATASAPEAAAGSRLRPDARPAQAPRRARRGDRPGPGSRWPSRPGRSTTRAASSQGDRELERRGARRRDLRRRPPRDAGAGHDRGQGQGHGGRAVRAPRRRASSARCPGRFDFEAGAVPRHWIGAGPRFKVTDLGGNKRLHKPPQEAGLQRATVMIGPPSLSGYTVEADLLFTRQGRRAGDLGLINRATRSTSWARSRSCSSGPGPPSSRSRRRSRSRPSPTSGTA